MADVSAPPLKGPERHRALPATEVLTGRNQWLIRLRWVAVAGTVVFAEIAARTVPITLHLGRIRLLAVSLALYNAIAWLVLRREMRRAERPSDTSIGTTAEDRPGGVGRWLLPTTSIGSLPYDRQSGRAAIFALAQITVDLWFLGVLLHVAGGVENPAWVFFAFHVIFASVLLSSQATVAIATYATLLQASVVVGEMNGRLPHFSLGPHWGPDSYREPRLIAAYLFLQAATLLAAAYLGSSIAGRLRRREVDVFVLNRYLAEKGEHLEAAYQELSIAEKSKSQYMRKVAHELRQPLGTIKTALTVALENAGDSLDPQTRTLIARAERRAGALAEMTQELLSLSRARGGRAAVSLSPLDLAVVAARVLEEQQNRALEKGVALAVEIEPGLPPLPGDAEGLADLIGNLVGNAIRYTPAGGSAWFRARMAGERMVLEVEDTGIGIPESEHARIFEEFYRSPAAREHEPQGSGLGLAIVMAVVEQHQGSIAVEDRAGGGTRFRVELPAECAEPVSAT